MTGAVIARWNDGAPAAVESPLGAGCIRSVAIGVPSVGDDALRPGFLRLVADFAARCGGGSATILDSTTVSDWATAGAPTNRATQAAADEVARPRERHVTNAESHALERWLLIAVALALLVEWWLRRQRTAAAALSTSPQSTSREAA